MGFGELALLKNMPRLASIVCDETCHLATLNKHSFMKILKEDEENKVMKQIKFFARMPLFKMWNLNLLKLLYLNTFRVHFIKGQYLFKEGQPSIAVYIANQGEFTVSPFKTYLFRITFFDGSIGDQVVHLTNQRRQR